MFGRRRFAVVGEIEQERRALERLEGVDQLAEDEVGECDGVVVEIHAQGVALVGYAWRQVVFVARIDGAL